MSQAKTLTPEQVKQVVAAVVAESNRPAIDRVVFALSFRAGLRACEMAGVRWRDVLDGGGDGVIAPGKMWHVPDNVAKKGAGRRIPMHPDLHAALVAARATLPAEATTPEKTVVLRSVPFTGEIDPRWRGTTANTLQKYISRRFRAAGAVGCSSHSGRRTFITELARRANKHGCSLRDVQKIAGHSSISTTERYVDLSEGVGDLVGSL